MNQLKKVNASKGKEVKEASKLQIELEEKLRDCQEHLRSTFHKNKKLERDMVRLKKEFNKSLK